MPLISKPKYPVVDPDPSMGRTVSNFNLTDWRNVFLFTTGGYCTGFFGSRLPLRRHNAAFLTGIGLLAGVMFACQNSTQRLIGLEPNESEVKRYGVLSDEELALYTKRANIPNWELIGAGRDEQGKKIQPK